MRGARVMLVGLALAAAGEVLSAAGPQGSTASADARALLDQYCVTCHNSRLKTGGLSLDRVDVSDLSAGSEIWEKVVLKLRAGMMPPQGRPRPATERSDALVAWLEESLDRAAAADPHPGRTHGTADSAILLRVGAAPPTGRSGDAQ